MYGVALLIGFVAEFTLPIEHLWQPVSPWLGVVVVAVSVVIGCSAFNALIRSETAFDARKPTTLIVAHGAFRYSRNPTYLSLSLLYVGIALALGSFWVLLMAVPAVLTTHYGVVVREERYLDEKLGEQYRRYTASVPRWF